MDNALQVGNDLDHAVQKVSLAVRTCNGSQTEGVGPRFVEPIINASIAITASLLDLNPQELTLESNVPVVGKLAYGTLDFMINGKQGGVPIKVSEAEQAFTSADEAQLLVQMATVRDISETADQASTANANLMHDIFGILTSGRTWAFYKYEPGSAAPTYATLSMPEGEGLEPQVKVVIEAIVGIMRQLSGAG
ncbi:g701 [Coccomyxa viridis]|uniref:G701 protein n=1 Tax=Coccomyxa viridis TaxID=1274662 RepID=A0ABP1FGB2_9CHLO